MVVILTTLRTEPRQEKFIVNLTSITQTHVHVFCYLNAGEIIFYYYYYKLFLLNFSLLGAERSGRQATFTLLGVIHSTIYLGRLTLFRT
jgi:hypothetical protein